MQAKDITDEALLRAVVIATDARSAPWANRFDVGVVLGEEIPEKVVLAKARKMIRQKKLYGCACGCRGDWRLKP